MIVRWPPLVLALLACAVACATVRAGQVPAPPTEPGSVATGAGQQPAAPQPPVDLLWRTDATAGSNDRRHTQLGVNVGADQDGGFTFDGRGSFFAPFGRRSAVQLQGSYAWYHDSREGQLDLALVNRFDRVQFGLFSSVRFVNVKAFDSGGRALSQAGATVDYLLPHGRIGAFATGALRDRAVLGRLPAGYNVLDEGYLHLVDQFGADGQVDAGGRARLEGHLAVLTPTGQGRTTGGAIRLIYPVTERWAVSAEGAWNPYLVSHTTQGRFTVGFRMSDPAPTVSPAVSAGGIAGSQPADAGPVPIDIPAIRYQVLHRSVRAGNDAPIADAGPDQTIAVDCQGEAACRVSVTLDGSASRDPESGPLTFAWTGRSGFSDERFTSPTNAARTTFEGTAGHTYVVRLQVTDDFGSIAFDEVTITILRSGA